MLYIVRDDEFENGFRIHRPTCKPIGPSQGRVSVTLQPHEELMLEVNRRFFDHPDAINALSPDALDCVRLQYRAMDDSEAPLFSNAVSCLARLKKLKELEFIKSDVTDADLLKLSGLTELQRLSAEAAFITGTSLAKLNWKNMREFYLQSDQIKPENVSAFARFPKLEALNLSSTHLTGPALKTLAGCSKLKCLRLNHNHSLGDDCLPTLLKLTKLQVLELKETAVTTRGLESLKPLPLKCLSITADKNTDVTKLKAIFGKALRLTASRGGVPGDFERTIFAPTSRD